MRFVPLVLNVVVVAAAILVYDTFRSPAGADYVAPTVQGRAEVAAPLPAAEPAGLVGRGDATWRSAFEARLAALERTKGPAGTPAAGLAQPVDEAEADAALDDLLALETIEGDGEPLAGEGSRFTERQLRTFRALLETVERERAVERAAARIDRMLDAAGVQLTDAQRAQVRDVTLDYQQKVRSLFESGAVSGSRDERRSAMQGVRDAYRQSLESIIPTAEADAILQQMATRGPRGPGGARGGRGGGGPQD